MGLFKPTCTRRLFLMPSLWVAQGRGSRATQRLGASVRRAGAGMNSAGGTAVALAMDKQSWRFERMLHQELLVGEDSPPVALPNPVTNSTA